MFVGFLAGFVTVLCIGNYLRAKSAMERQRDRRIARLAGRNKVRSTESTPGSPRSHLSVGTSHTGASEHHRLISRHDIQHRQPSINSGGQLKNNDNYSNSSQYMTPHNGPITSQRNSHKEEDLLMLKENDDAYEKDSSFMSV